MVELVNEGDEPIELEPGESARVDGDIETRRGMVKRRRVVRLQKT